MMSIATTLRYYASQIISIEGIDNAWCLLSTPRCHLRPHPRRYLEILMLQSTVR